MQTDETTPRPRAIRPTDEEDAEIRSGIEQDTDNPEWTDEDFARARLRVMNNSAYWLHQVEDTHKDLQNNNQALAEVLGISRASVSHQKRGKYAMGVKTAVQCAYMLEVHPMLVVASTQYDSAATESDRVFWLSTYLKWADKAPRNVKPPITEYLPEIDLGS